MSSSISNYCDSAELPDSIVAAITLCAKGRYQAELLAGGYLWSGAGLQGRARQFGARYSKSRANLLTRINNALPKG